MKSFDIEYNNGFYEVHASLMGTRMCFTETKGQAEAIVNVAEMRIGKDVVDNKCPSCGSLVEKEFEFCPKCGQFLFWRRE